MAAFQILRYPHTWIDPPRVEPQTSIHCLCGVKEIINLKFPKRTPKRHIESSLSPKLRALYQKQMRKTHDNISDTFAVCNAIVNCVRRQPNNQNQTQYGSPDLSMGEYRVFSYLNVPLHMRNVSPSASQLSVSQFSALPKKKKINKYKNVNPHIPIPKPYPYPFRRSTANIFCYQTIPSPESN